MSRLDRNAEDLIVSWVQEFLLDEPSSTWRDFGKHLVERAKSQRFRFAEPLNFLRTEMLGVRQMTPRPR
jgi:hypothetical protein